MIALECVVQKYDWGKKGSTSAVAKLKSSGCDDFQLDEEVSYAELWMGTHPSGPARVCDSDELFLDWLSSRSSAVGRVPKGYQGNDLPFMFKVLSVKTALSIQAHPDKLLARRLHIKWPDIYRDANHKPEMSIALTPFQAMCGFRPIDEIKKNLERYPELKAIIGEKVCDRFKSHIDDGSKTSFSDMVKALFTAYMQCDEDTARTQINILLKRISPDNPLEYTPPPPLPLLDTQILLSSFGEISTSSKRKTRENSITHSTYEINSDDSSVRTLILHLNKDYPNDLGALCPLLLNCLNLSEGEAFFMGSNEPHAYISGDCVEAMALSDNVVRAGLTPKYKDVSTLCAMLHYGYGKPSSFIRPVPLDKYTLLYRPPPKLCAEFEVEMISIPGGSDAYHPNVIDCGCVILMLKGKTCQISEGNNPFTPFKLGSVLFISANCDITILAGRDDIVMYRAHVNLGDGHMCPMGY